MTEEEYMIIQEGRSADGDYREISPWAVQFLKEYDKYLESPILEIGCGNGAVLEYLKKKKYFAMGIDISRPSIQKCLKHGFPAVHHNVDNGLPFPDKSFKTVLSFHMLEHCRNPKFVIEETERVLDGHSCIITPGGEDCVDYGHFGNFNINDVKDFLSKSDIIISIEDYNTGFLVISKTNEKL